MAKSIHGLHKNVHVQNGAYSNVTWTWSDGPFGEFIDLHYIFYVHHPKIKLPGVEISNFLPLAQHEKKEVPVRLVRAFLWLLE